MEYISGYTFENWIEEAAEENSVGIGYWNDEQNQSQKRYNKLITDGSIVELELYLSEIGYLSALKACIIQLDVHGMQLKGCGLDLAAGVLWSIPHLLKNKVVEKIYALDFSAYSLKKMGVKLLQKYAISKERITLVLGSFYKLKLKNDSLDFIHISAALHHAESPLDLLMEMSRVLRQGGLVIMPMELYVTNFGYFKYRLLDLFPRILKEKIWGISILQKKNNNLSPEIVGYDPVLGDHFYHIKHYDQLFEQAGFVKIYAKYADYASFILQKK